ncbi:galactosyltransferase-domain-containing protein [Cyathus striatus]|nr:galactosyltransferase-domain-containing protein [Cyathus striatus]
MASQVPYIRLETDDSESYTTLPSYPSKKFARFRPWLKWRPLSIILCCLILIATFIVVGIHIWLVPFGFNRDPRPSWLDVPPLEPLVLRVAIISKADEFNRRQALRDAVFHGVRESEVKMVYKFFVGHSVGNTTSDAKIIRLETEKQTFNDIIQLDDIDDRRNRISEKRFAALKWGGSVPRNTYDYFMTMDSDTFVRFGTLARRMPVIFNEDVNPREQDIIIARMRGHDMYWINRVEDGNKDSDTKEDQFIRGPWFKYPVGIGYMLSSRLVDTLLETNPPVPHHIRYPYDDVMVGSWIASLKNFHDPRAQFWTLPEFEHDPISRLPHRPSQIIHPKPILPHKVDVNIMNDWVGWHDYVGRGGRQGSFSWSSVCVHHVSADEIRKFRKMKEIKDEWE